MDLFNRFKASFVSNKTRPVVEKKPSGMEVIIRDKIVPHESKIMWIQSLLVWEKPLHTSVAFVLVHLIFWILLQLRLFYIVGLVGFCFMTYDLWIHYIWPEIRVPPPTDEEAEEWTHVHPRMLSVHEICDLLCKLVAFIQRYSLLLTQMRRETPGKFFVYSTGFFISLGMLGHYISGTWLIYIFILSVFLGPMLYYHQYLDQIYSFIQPYMQSFSSASPSRPKKSPVSAAENESPVSGEDSETELESLMPPALDQDKSSQVSLTDSETSRLSPAFSRSALDDQSDDDTQIQGLPGEMPSINTMATDTFSLDSRFSQFQEGLKEYGDSSDDNLSDVWDGAAKSKLQPEELPDAIKFVSQHFGGQLNMENSAETAGLEEGLEFPDVDINVTDTSAGTQSCQQNKKDSENKPKEGQTQGQSVLQDGANNDSLGQLEDFEVLSQQDIT